MADYRRCHAQDCIANNFDFSSSNENCSAKDCYGSIKQALMDFCTYLPTQAWGFDKNDTYEASYNGMVVNIIKVKIILINSYTNEKIGVSLQPNDDKDCESMLPIIEAIESNPNVDMTIHIEVVGTLEENSALKKLFYNKTPEMIDNKEFINTFWGFGPVRKNQRYWPYLCKIHHDVSSTFPLGFVGVYDNIKGVVRNARNRLISLTFNPIVLRNLANVLQEAQQKLPTDVLESVIAPYLMQQYELPPNQYQRKRVRTPPRTPLSPLFEKVKRKQGRYARDI
jgi:hypothetical protein